LIVDKYPEHFAWFCNVDARQGSNSPETNFTPYLEVCKANGANVLVAGSAFFGSKDKPAFTKQIEA